MIDLLFRVNHIGDGIPADHGYALFSAISRIVESPSDKWLHENKDVGLHLIRGMRAAAGKILPDDMAEFGLRLPQELIVRALNLAGKKLDLDGSIVRIGVSRTRALIPAPVLYSRLATTKNGHDPARFDKEIARQLESLGVHGKATRVPVKAEEDRYDPSRRVFRIKDKTVVGYSVLVEELTAEESVRLQENGVGGRRRMGCGVFVPFRVKK